MRHSLRVMAVLGLLGIFLLSSLLPALATITVEQISSTYNLGQEFHPRVSVLLASRFDGFQESSVMCDGYSTTYSRSPFHADAGLPVPLLLPPLTLFVRMKGECRLSVSLETNEGIPIEAFTTPPFVVTDLLSVEVRADEPRLRPGTSLLLEGRVRDSRGNPVATTLLAESGILSQRISLPPGTFSITLTFPSSFPSGPHTLFLSFSDKLGNVGLKNLPFTMDAIPETLRVELNDDVYLPSEELNAAIQVLDQAGQPLEREIHVRILSGLRTVHETKQFSSIFSYPISRLEAGDYVLSASAERMEEDAPFSVAAVRQLDSSLQGTSALFTNTGNVPYRNTTALIVIRDGEKVLIEKRISLDPGETYEMELGEELDSGVYDVVLPSGETLEDVAVEDTRGPLKKLTGGLSGLTGNVVAATPGTYSLGFLFFFLVLIVTLAVIQYLSQRKS